MNRVVMRAVVLAASIAVLLVAAFVAWSDERSRPVAVTQRVIATIASREAGATGAEIAPGWVRINLPSGTLVDVALDEAFARCARLFDDCRRTIAAIADEVDAVQKAARSPRLDDVVPLIVADAATTAVYGYVSRPLLGSLEVRYGVVRGAARSYLTAAGIAASNTTRAQLADAALANLRKRPAPRAQADGDGVFRVDDAGDPTSNLVDPDRMKTIADGVGAGPLACGIPARGRLFVTGPDPTAQAALAARLARGKHEMPNDPARAGVFACDLATGNTSG